MPASDASHLQDRRGSPGNRGSWQLRPGLAKDLAGELAGELTGDLARDLAGDLGEAHVGNAQEAETNWTRPAAGQRAEPPQGLGRAQICVPRALRSHGHVPWCQPPPGSTHCSKNSRRAPTGARPTLGAGNPSARACGEIQ